MTDYRQRETSSSDFGELSNRESKVPPWFLYWAGNTTDRCGTSLLSISSV